MSDQAEKKVLLSLRNVVVKFNVRGRILTAIRNVSLDIFENESLAIVGESGSGKSVLTKTFAGMLDSNGFIDQGTIIFSDDEISRTDASLSGSNLSLFNRAYAMLNRNSKFERGAKEYKALQEKEEEIRHKKSLTVDEEADFNSRLKTLKDEQVETNNYLMTLDRRNDAAEMAANKEKIKELTAKIEALEVEKKNLIRTRQTEYKNHPEGAQKDKMLLEELKQACAKKVETPDNPNNPEGLSDKVLERNKILAYEVVLSIARYSATARGKYFRKLDKAFKNAMMNGEDLNDPDVRNKTFEVAGFRVEFRSLETPEERAAAMETAEGKDLEPLKAPMLHGYAIIDCAKVKYADDWQKIRGTRIATVFQDPMTSLNPVITIGKQIMTVILKHQKCSKAEARQRTIDIMGKVGIPEPESRFDDYPFEYSGGMRQRIVIAIALSCQPKILICDEPTTALDVTIQAQILRLIKDLQKELGFTVVYITHDLGVVANVAERVAVLYGGQIVEMGTVEEIFYEPKHPYTWALLSSLPQLGVRGTDLFYIAGTPPSLYNKIRGDAFAPRNQYAMAIDLQEEPPMFQVSPTHFAKTWLLDPRAPKAEGPENIKDLHKKIEKTYVNFEA